MRMEMIHKEESTFYFMSGVTWMMQITIPPNFVQILREPNNLKAAQCMTEDRRNDGQMAIAIG